MKYFEYKELDHRTTEQKRQGYFTGDRSTTTRQMLHQIKATRPHNIGNEQTEWNNKKTIPHQLWELIKSAYLVGK